MSTRHLSGSSSGGRTFYPTSNSSTVGGYRTSDTDNRGPRTSYSRGPHFAGRGGPTSPPPPIRGGHSAIRRGGGPIEFSSYYRDRFGSHSPEEYKNLRLSHIDPKVQNTDLRDILEKEFRRYGEMEVKIVPQGNSISDRLAYINFDRPELARRARKNCLPKLAEILGKYLKVDPAGVIRDQDGRYVEQGRPLQPQLGPLLGAACPHPHLCPPLPPNKGYYDRGPPAPRVSPETITILGTTTPQWAHLPAEGSALAHPQSTGVPRGRPRSPPRRRASLDRGDQRPHSRGSLRSPGSQMPPRRAQQQKNRPGSGQREHRAPVTGGNATAPASGTQQSTILENWKLQEDLEQGATRTLFVGNLPGNIREGELKKVFEKFGRLEDIDIKHPHESSGGAYAFVMYQNMDEAQLAKYKLQDQLIAGQRCKIGYGKPVKSCRLWVGGLGPWTSLESLEKEFDRYGAIEKIDYVRGGNHAYVLFASLDAASAACGAMKGFPLGGRDRCIRVDFASESRASESASSTEEEKRRRRKPSGARKVEQPPSRKRSRSKEGRAETAKEMRPEKAPRRGPHTPPNSPPASPPDLTPNAPAAPAQPAQPAQQHLSAGNLTELEQIRSPCWTGALVLKKSAYPIRLYNLRGDDDLIDALLRDATTRESVKLHVTQRLPYNQACPGDFQRYLQLSASQSAFLLAGPNPNATAADLRLANAPTRPLKAFVHYLSEKSAAGVVSLFGGSSGSGGPGLYVFPRCDLADNLLKQLSPDLTVMRNCSEDCLLAVLVRGNAKTTTTAPQTPAAAAPDAGDKQKAEST